MVGGGSTASFTLSPTAIYRQSNTVTGTCPKGSWNGNQYTTGSISGSCTVGFSFVKITYPLTITFTGTGGGRVAVLPKPPGTDCTGTCNETFDMNTLVTLIPTADASSGFVGFSGDCNGAEACQVTMDSAKNVTATFEPKVDGICGAANGAPTSTAPTANLCSTGTASVVTGSGPWNWSCDGLYSGANVTCSANLDNWNVSVTLAGSGSGSVNSSPAGIACTGGTCSTSFQAGTKVTLLASPATSSLFTSWSAGCTADGTTCTIDSLNANVEVTATFTANMKLKLLGTATSYATLQDAYVAASDGETFLMQVYSFIGNLNFNLPKNVKLHGGKDSDYANTVGFTTIEGSLTIEDGSVEISDVAIW